MKDVKIVIGANYGDEGKGIMTSYFCKNSNTKILNILSNGGSQRGHRVVTGKYDHIFHHFGSGTFDGADTYFPPTYIINPMNFIKELMDIYKTSIITAWNRKFYLHIDCKFSTPYDIMFNQIEQLYLIKSHNSCGEGIWKTKQRYNNTKYNLSFYQFIRLTDEEKKKYLSGIREYYAKQWTDMPDEYKDSYYSEGTLEHFLDDCNLMFKWIEFTDMDPSEFSEYNHLVFENGQGLLLGTTHKLNFNQDREEDKTITSSDTGVGILANCFGSSKALNHTLEICYVTRSYLTRHGDGELEKETISKNVSGYIDTSKESNHYNDFQGKFRYAPLDIDSLMDRIQSDLINYYNSQKFYCKIKISLAITHMDEISLDIEKIKKYKLFNTIYISSSEHTENIEKIDCELEKE